MKARQKNNIPFFQFESLPEDARFDKRPKVARPSVAAQRRRIQHAVFTRQGGVSPAPFESLNLSVSVPDEKERVYANRRRAYGVYGRDTDTVVHAHLVHGTSVAAVTQADNGTWSPRVDGIITNETDCALTMNYADCGPVFLYDPVHHAIGLGHAGWQGAVEDLPGAMALAMQAQFGSDPAQLIAGLGPSIGPCCYEVGEPVITAVHNAFADPETLLIQPTSDSQRPHFDLPEANRRNLERAGVRHIEQPGLCTACRTDLFFSHRAEKGKTGRFGAIFILK
ncbi:MAG: peptidoglycan editing factor PgeF [Chloroflexi bacterium]|nr:peptidoglycan editing factor PgeF [Chloroflexota bacterium]